VREKRLQKTADRTRTVMMLQERAELVLALFWNDIDVVEVLDWLSNPTHRAAPEERRTMLEIVDQARESVRMLRTAACDPQFSLEEPCAKLQTAAEAIVRFGPELDACRAREAGGV
jgi:hypothetical protein